MLSWDEAERLKREAVDRSHRSVYLAIVLSVVLSLMAVSILSKKHLTNELWADVTACVVPALIFLYFKKRIVSLGLFTYVAVVVIALLAAIVFGI